MNKIIRLLQKKRKSKTSQSKPHVLILRDYLAVDRTKLSNDRALLAHIGTGITVLAAGVSGFNLFFNLLMRGLSVGLMILGAGIFISGIIRYKHMEKRLNLLGTPDYERLIIEATKNSKSTPDS